MHSLPELPPSFYPRGTAKARLLADDWSIARHGARSRSAGAGGILREAGFQWPAPSGRKTTSNQAPLATCRMSVRIHPRPRRFPRVTQLPADRACPPGPSWQSAAWACLWQGRCTTLGTNDAAARAFLLARRGRTPAIFIGRAQTSAPASTANQMLPRAGYARGGRFSDALLLEFKTDGLLQFPSLAGREWALPAAAGSQFRLRLRSTGRADRGIRIGAR